MTALITGGSKGIGRAIVQILCENGVDVIINARNLNELKALQSDLVVAFPEREITISSNDLSAKAECEALANVVKQKGGLDILVNNAGVYLGGSSIIDEADGQLETMMDTNLYSAYHLTRYLMPTLLKSGAPHIFNMCSVASILAYPNGGSYSISKFALLGFSKVLREELKQKGVKVTSILPGATWSNSWAGVEMEESRLMQARDIAIAVWSAIQMSPSAVVEDIIIRPQLGDL